MGAVTRALATAWDAQHGALFPWVPVCLATGIGLFFSLRAEPSGLLLVLCAVAGLCGIAVSLRSGPLAGPLFLGLALVGLGVSLAGARAHGVAAPVLEGRYYGAVVGRIVDIDRSANDAVRLTLDHVDLPDLWRGQVPDRVRVALYGEQGFTVLRIGARVMTTAHLSAPPGPAEPHGFDFRRHAWFEGLGGVGYTRVPVLSLPHDPAGLGLRRLRQTIADRVRSQLDGPPGAMAAAILTGDRSALPQPMLDALRDSNLAHLLAISGLHMGLLAGAVFGALRLGFVLLPRIGLSPWAKKASALGALAAAAFYLALSGGNVATERAFVMVAVGLLAILLDRRVLSLRSVALAATIVLVLRPEALTGPGFQMSFAATTALVVVFGRVSRADWLPRNRLLKGAATVVLSSAIAGAATAPVGMAHFNQIAHYGLLANVLAVPLMGILVIPAGLVVAVLMPLGLEAPALWAMGMGIRWILFVAQTVAGWPGAVSGVVQPAPAVLPLLAGAALWAVVVQGRARWAGFAGVAVALALWAGTGRPDLLIARDGGLVGVMTPAGRALSRDRTAAFVAGLWLENDGLGQNQPGAAALWTGQGVTHVTGKKAAGRVQSCSTSDLVVSNAALPDDLPCHVWDAARLAQTGAVAGYRGAEGWRFVTSRDVSGHRLWSPETWDQ